MAKKKGRNRGFQGIVSKMKLVSNCMCYGPEPEDGEELEQHLTVSRDGRIWFSAYGYDHKSESGLRLIRKYQEKISPEAANYFLANVAYLFSEEVVIPYATDVGSWDLVLTNEEGEASKFGGSLVPIIDELNRVSAIFRTLSGHNDYYMFDGNDREENELSEEAMNSYRTLGQAIRF